MFIVFEGVDGSGKDTQLNKVFDYLWEKNKNLQIWKTKEPTWYTVSWKQILEKLSNSWFDSAYEALDLYVQDRKEQTVIRQEILKHSCILCSRFDYSTYVYQWLQWISFEEVYKKHDYKNIIIPDITFIFDVSKENIEKRLKIRGWNQEYFENIDFLTQANKKYIQVAQKLSEERNIYIINANQDKAEVFMDIKKILDIKFSNYAI